MDNDQLREPGREPPFAFGSPTAAPHPEELTAAVEVRAGNWLSIRATARATPAGLMATALLTAAILVPLLRFASRGR